MNRREFIQTSGLLAASVGKCHGASEVVDSETLVNSEQDRVLRTEFTAQCEPGYDSNIPDICLEVALEREDVKGDLPQTRLVRFSLRWGREQIQVPARFWNDLTRLRIEDFPDGFIKRLDPAQRQQYLDTLTRPRLYRSEEGGTVLVVWERSEEGCITSTIRWIISRSGQVLRHRESPIFPS